MEALPTLFRSSRRIARTCSFQQGLYILFLPFLVLRFLVSCCFLSLLFCCFRVPLSRCIHIIRLLYVELEPLARSQTRQTAITSAIATPNKSKPTPCFLPREHFFHGTCWYMNRTLHPNSTLFFNIYIASRLHQLLMRYRQAVNSSLGCI